MKKLDTCKHIQKRKGWYILKLKNKVLTLALIGMLIISSLSFSATKKRKKITAIKAKQTALMRVPGATLANVLEFNDSTDGDFYKGQISYRGVAYNFEINVYNGKIVSWSEEKSK